MKFGEDEKKEFQEFQKQRASFVEPFMKKEVPNFNAKPGAKRALYLEHPPLPKKMKKTNKGSNADQAGTTRINKPVASQSVAIPDADVQGDTPHQRTPQQGNPPVATMPKERTATTQQGNPPVAPTSLELDLYASSSSASVATPSTKVPPTTPKRTPSSSSSEASACISIHAHGDIEEKSSTYKAPEKETNKTLPTFLSISANENGKDKSLTYEVPETESAPKYLPSRIDEQTTKLKGMAEQQFQRVILNIGGKKFETSNPTLSSDPSSILAHLVMKNSPMKPYDLNGIQMYFIDRNPRYFDFILDYLRSPNSISQILPNDRTMLRQLHVEASWYGLTGLTENIENKANAGRTLWDE